MDSQITIRHWKEIIDIKQNKTKQPIGKIKPLTTENEQREEENINNEINILKREDKTKSIYIPMCSYK